MEIFEKKNQAIANKGVIIDKKGYIIRLSVSPAGKFRVGRNKFIIAENTVVGPIDICEEFDTAEEAIARFEQVKKMVGKYWREDDRVMYM